MSTEEFPKPETLAFKLRRIRENFRLTHGEMAEELKAYELQGGRVDADTIREVETERLEVPLLLLLAYSKYSGIPVNSLIDDEVQPFP